MSMCEVNRCKLWCDKILIGPEGTGISHYIGHIRWVSLSNPSLPLGRLGARLLPWMELPASTGSASGLPIEWWCALYQYSIQAYHRSSTATGCPQTIKCLYAHIPYLPISLFPCSLKSLYHYFLIPYASASSGVFVQLSSVPNRLLRDSA